MDTSVDYMGLRLPHPFIAGSSPLADTLDGARRLEDGGAAALVLRSLFEEQIGSEAVSAFLPMSEDRVAETLPLGGSDGVAMTPTDYLEHIAVLKSALDIPVIASLNGATLGGWLSYSRALQEAGADGLELNVYSVPVSDQLSSEDIEKETLEMVREVTSVCSIPVAVKLSAFYTALPHFARKLEDAGAANLVLFNRFFDVDVDDEGLEVISRMQLSDSAELLPRLRWLAILSGLLRKAGLTVSGGVHQRRDAVKALLCGACCIQLVAAVIRQGPEIFTRLRVELGDWLDAHDYAAVEQIRGRLNLLRAENPNAFSRANYLNQLRTWEPEE